MTGSCTKLSTFDLGFITILLLLMGLHEIQMPVMWQIECFVSIYNARIVDNLGKFIFNCLQPGTLVHLMQFVQ